MKKLVLAFLATATGCAAFARERSPKPEAAQLTIKATTDEIRALLLADFVAQGFTIDSEVAGTQLQISKPARETDIVSPGRFLHDQMIGQGVGGHNRNCRRTHRVIFLPDGDSTAVTMQWFCRSDCFAARRLRGSRARTEKHC